MVDYDVFCVPCKSLIRAQNTRRYANIAYLNCFSSFPPILFYHEAIFNLETLQDNDWRYHLSCQSEFANRCPWEELDGRAWCWLLIDQPKFANQCPWDKLCGDGWSYLLRFQPQFADKCDWEKLKDLDGELWDELLSDQPQFADKRPSEQTK